MPIRVKLSSYLLPKFSRVPFTIVLISGIKRYLMFMYYKEYVVGSTLLKPVTEKVMTANIIGFL